MWTCNLRCKTLFLVASKHLTTVNVFSSRTLIVFSPPSEKGNKKWKGYTTFEKIEILTIIKLILDPVVAYIYIYI